MDNYIKIVDVKMRILMSLSCSIINTTCTDNLIKCDVTSSIE